MIVVYCSCNSEEDGADVSECQQLVYVQVDVVLFTNIQLC